MGGARAEHEVEVAAPPRRCFEALLDYEGMPEWQQSVRSTEVVARGRDGRAREVAWEVDAKVRTVSYTLAYEYDEPDRIRFHMVEGDVKEVAGEWTFQDRGDGTSLVRLEMEMDPGVWLPGRVKRVLEDQVLRGSLDDLKRHLEG